MSNGRESESRAGCPHGEVSLVEGRLTSRLSETLFVDREDQQLAGHISRGNQSPTYRWVRLSQRNYSNAYQAQKP